jgi:GNAT superfamily N-acetyltransferase
VRATPVGTCTVFILPLLAHAGAPEAIVEDVAVHPRAQSQGIGRALMQHAMRLAREAGCYKLALSSNLKRERAHAFYERLGFERHGVSFSVELETLND